MKRHGWNLADLLEALAAHDPEALAQTWLSASSRRFTWGDFERRSRAVANALLSSERGMACSRQGKVAQYLYNGPEYMESVFACFRASLVPVNTNYRYVEAELVYLWDNADAEAVIFHGTFAERIEELRSRVPRVHTWLWVDDGSGACPDWAIPYEDIAESRGAYEGRSEAPLAIEQPRSGDDLWLLYTGGTTGMPKGVMWRQDDLWQIINAGRLEPFDLEGGLEGVEAQFDAKLTRPVQLPACPLMHGTGFLTALGALLGGGRVVTLAARRFDPDLVLEAITREKVQSLAIVGDAFCRPLVERLDLDAIGDKRFDITSLLGVVSSGTMWSEKVKRGLLRHHGEMILADGLGSSESIGMGKSESSGEQAAGTAAFELGERACVLTEDGRVVEPGSGERGRIATSQFLPVGYYKDPEKTAATFPVIDGVRYSVAGDWATVEADGTIRLLGRGSVCINTGGEKVFPEEVEETLKKHTAVRDALCVGVADERFGQAVTAVVELHPGAEVSESELVSLVREHLAAYKAPRRVLFRESLDRAANGKADYNGLRAWAEAQLA